MSIEEKFLAAVDIINSIPNDGTFQPSEDLMLKLYAYYKQATEGPCNVPQPSIWHLTSRIKWSAWNELGNVTREEAMEKYVEELTKVIETMSYNEKVSHFMSLIGPFYEIVSTEDDDQAIDKNTNSRNHSEFPYPVKNLEDLTSLQDETSHVEIIESTISSITEVSHVGSPNSPETPSVSCLYSRSPTSNLTIKEDVIELFKPKPSNNKYRPVVSQQDLLILALINLKSSLDDIRKRLERLHTLAKSANLNNKPGNEDEPKTWELGLGGTALALLWPIAVHFLSGSF